MSFSSILSAGLLRMIILYNLPTPCMSMLTAIPVVLTDYSGPLYPNRKNTFSKATQLSVF
jgi:hypothetical protein